jgi:hypothetical protein
MDIFIYHIDMIIYPLYIEWPHLCVFGRVDTDEVVYGLGGSQ